MGSESAMVSCVGSIAAAPSCLGYPGHFLPHLLASKKGRAQRAIPMSIS